MSRISVSKRILRTGVAAALALTMFPAAAFADDPQTNTFTDTWQNQSRISITSPVALVFGADGNGWDKGSEKMPTAVGTFKNTGDIPVFIQRVQYLPVKQENEDNNAFTKNVEDAVSAVTISDRCKYDAVSKQTIDASSTDGEQMTQAITLAPDTSTKIDYELVLHEKDGNNKDLIKSSAYDGGQTAWPIGKIKYIFEAANFWLTDLRDEDNPVTYTLDEVKDQALKVARANEKTDENKTEEEKYWLEMYKAFVNFPNVGKGVTEDSEGNSNCDGNPNYSCGVKLGNPYNTYYKLNVIGVNQDRLTLASGQTQTSDGRKMAGLTFMFEDILHLDMYSHNYTEANRSIVNRGWVNSDLRKAMNQDSSYTQANSDHPDPASYKPIYDAFDNDNEATNIKTVRKASCYSRFQGHYATYDWYVGGGIGNQIWYSGALGYTNDRLFTPSFTEIVSYNYGYAESPVSSNPSLQLASNGGSPNTSYYFGTPDGVLDSSGNATGYQYSFFSNSGIDWIWALRFVDYSVGVFGWHLTNKQPDSALKYLIKEYNGKNTVWWLRTQAPSWNHWQMSSSTSGDISDFSVAYSKQGVVPCFCL